MQRRTILKGIGATGLLAAGGATPGMAAVTDAPDGGELHLTFDGDRENVVVDPADVTYGDDAIRVDLGDEVVDIDPICNNCCDMCECYSCLCYWCPPEPIQM